MVAEAKSSSRVFLLSSLVLGVLAMVAAFVFLQTTAGQEQGPKVKVYVAKHDLRENAPLDPDKDFDELEIPVRFTSFHALALVPEARGTYKGQRLNRSVPAGAPLFLADLGIAGSIDLHADTRAMSIPVKGANALSGLIVPGDSVKVMVTRPIPAARFGAAATTAPSEGGGPPPAPFETVLVSQAPFRVLAVNQRMSRSRAQATAAEAYQSAGDSNANQTVTLEVTEAQAKTILEQTGAGQLPVTLLLCPAAAPGATGAQGSVGR